jgi:hypothetical protein
MSQDAFLHGNHRKNFPTQAGATAAANVYDSGFRVQGSRYRI